MSGLTLTGALVCIVGALLSSAALSGAWHQREAGANLIAMLEHLSETIRERLLFPHKLAVVTAEVHVSDTILASLPLLGTGALLLLQPGCQLPLVTTSLGQSLVAGAAVSLLLGVGLMRSLAPVRV